MNNNYYNPNTAPHAASPGTSAQPVQQPVQQYQQPVQQYQQPVQQYQQPVQQYQQPVQQYQQPVQQYQQPVQQYQQPEKKSPVLKRVGMILGACVALFAASLLAVFPMPGGTAIELGDSVPTRPQDYLFGYGFIVGTGEVDYSAVDSSKVGEYHVRAKALFYDYDITVKVEDTTPPTINPPKQTLYIATGKEYQAEAFAGEIIDYSEQVNCQVEYQGSKHKSISFPTPGEYSLTLDAEDASGNSSRCEISFMVDDPPVFVGVIDRHLPVGTDFNINRAAAVDTEDGNLSSMVKIDNGGFNPRKEGKYTVTYTVSDSHGLETVTTAEISVISKDQLSLYSDEVTLTTAELELLCNSGFFRYTPLDEPDLDKTIQLIEPTLVDFVHRTYNGYVGGSGSVYKITPDYVYLLSVEHVLTDMTESCELMFYDGTVINESFSFYTGSKENELALCRIPVSDVPAETLLTLRQIYYEPDIYSQLAVGDNVVAYAKHWMGGNQDLIRTLTVTDINSSIIEFEWYNSLIKTTEGIVGGMSGTAVVDYKARLVGVVSASGDHASYHSMVDVLEAAEQALEADNRAA